MTTQEIRDKTEIEKLRETFGIEKESELSPIISEALFQICDDIEKYAQPSARIKFDAATWGRISESQCRVCLAGIGILTGRLGAVLVGTAVDQSLDQRFGTRRYLRSAACARTIPHEVFNLQRSALNGIRCNNAESIALGLQFWLEALQLKDETEAEKSLRVYLEQAESNAEWSSELASIYDGFEGWQDLPKLRALAEHFKQHGI